MTIEIKAHWTKPSDRAWSDRQWKLKVGKINMGVQYYNALSFRGDPKVHCGFSTLPGYGKKGCFETSAAARLFVEMGVQKWFAASLGCDPSAVVLVITRD